MASILFSGFLLVEDALAQRDDGKRFDEGFRVAGKVDARYRGGAEVPVSYLNPETEQQVETKTYVWRVTLPQAGDRVRLEVNRDDPGDVVLAGDRFTMAENLPFSVFWPALPLIGLGFRAWGVRRTRRLMEKPGTAFSMVGALAPPWRFGRWCHLHLYAVDAAPGAPAVCALPVLTTGGYPVPSGVFPVEVRGFPRPGGRVVARGAAGVTFWPASRALLSSKHLRPQLVEPYGPVTLEPVPAPPFRTTRRKDLLRLVWPEMAALAVTCAFLAMVVALTLTSAHRSEAAAAEADRVVAEVVKADELDYDVVVSFVDPHTGRPRRSSAPADFPEDHPVGRRYPVLVSGDSVRLAREPYDAGEPISWAAAPVVAAGVVAVRRCLRIRANRRTLASGPFRLATAWVLPMSGYRPRVGLGTPGRPLRVVAKVQAPPAAGAVVVAGEVEPGSPLALVVEGVAVLPTGPALSPPWPPPHAYVRP